MRAFVRVNGRGNAWPVFLGGQSKFYDASNSDDLSNASFSIVMPDNIDTKETVWEVLIDAGHHTVPFLIKNGNRLPEAVVLTHGHMDHTLGLDWIAQSTYYLSDKTKRLPVYATPPVWQFVKQSYPHLEKIIDYKPLLPGKKIELTEASGLKLTSFPVFHGEHAKGASMLMFEHEHISAVLFTGDMLCPLLRKKDWETISRCKNVFIDANNRFPYPASNHGSIISFEPDSQKQSKRLGDWFGKVNFNYIISPHVQSEYNKVHHTYFEEFLKDYLTVSELPATVQDFANQSKIPNMHLIHYGGMEDGKYYSQKVLSSATLEEWTKKQFEMSGLVGAINVPLTGDCISL